jgi:3-hydroxyisobutyrate dehydrogenase
MPGVDSASMNDQIQLAVLGAGSTMGLPMAGNIARSGAAVRGWNRTTEKATSLEDDGARLFDTPRDAGEGANVILTMLADADAVIDAAEQALERAAGDAIWLQMSTIGEAGTDRCIELAQERSLTLFDAPVLGTKQPAEEGKLVILASGPDHARTRVQPIFDAIGQKTIWVGPAGAGTRLKMVANSWVLTVTEGTAETIALAEGLGLEPQLFLDAIEGGTLDLPYLRIKARAIMERSFDPSFRLTLAAKDARLIEESAHRHELDLPLFSTIRRRMAEGAKEHGDKDFCATYLTSAPNQAPKS